MKFTEIPLKVKQKLGYFGFIKRINLAISPLSGNADSMQDHLLNVHES
jgi:hypothetical protein